MERKDSLDLLDAGPGFWWLALGSGLTPELASLLEMDTERRGTGHVNVHKHLSHTTQLRDWCLCFPVQDPETWQCAIL